MIWYLRLITSYRMYGLLYCTYALLFTNYDIPFKSNTHWQIRYPAHTVTTYSVTHRTCYFVRETEIFRSDDLWTECYLLSIFYQTDSIYSSTRVKYLFPVKFGWNMWLYALLFTNYDIPFKSNTHWQIRYPAHTVTTYSVTHRTCYFVRETEIFRSDDLWTECYLLSIFYQTDSIYSSTRVKYLFPVKFGWNMWL